MTSSSCSRCKKPLSGQFFRAEKLKLHPQCFYCDYCTKPLEANFQFKTGQLYHPECYKKRYKLVCAQCKHPLAQTWVESEGKKYHEACYREHHQPICVQCQQKIEGHYNRDELGDYHPACFEKHRLEPCAACQQPLVGKYLVDLWGNQVHTQHQGLPTLQCHTCSRLVSQATSQGGIQYTDGRVVCGICQITEITAPAQIELAKQRVIAQLQAVGFDYIPNYISVSLADKRLLNRRLGVSATANSHGLTKTLEKRQGTQVSREHSVFILYGLPRLVFDGVLAHELLHVWLNDRGLHHKSEKEIEGFCNLGTALIYQQDNSPLAQVLLKQMQQDRHPVYGEGYRKMQAQLTKRGWPGVIEAMRQPPSVAQKGLAFLDKWI